MDVLLVVDLALFAIPILIFLSYGLVLLYYGKLSHQTRNTISQSEVVSGVSYQPLVSIILPTHNEEDVIGKRIENLFASDYPRDKMEVIVVDDSSDSTVARIQSYTHSYPQIRIIRFSQRMGYSPCLIAGCKAARGDIIVLAEAASLWDSKVITQLLSNFKDPDIGVVTGKASVLNANEGAGRTESFYQRAYNFLRTAESNIDSTVYMRGEAAAVRREVIMGLEGVDTWPGTADTGLMLLARKLGFRSVYDPQVVFFEYAPATHGERVRQKVTRGANQMKILWTFREILLRPRYGKFGMITLPANLAMLALVPPLLLAGLILLAILTLMKPAVYFEIWAVGGLVLVLVLVFQRSALYTLIESEYSLLKGLYDIIILKKSHDKIDKVMSTRRS